MINFQSPLVLLLAAYLDYCLGDPWGWIHPVRVMGWIINAWTEFAIARFQRSFFRRLAGILLGIGLIVGSGCVGWSIVRLTSHINFGLGIAIETILLASCFAGRSLRNAAIAVLDPLSSGKLELARCELSQYVGRDTDNLSESEVLRAVLETVAENATDGVTAPLFYALVGACLSGVGSVPLALAYKAASTLDSTIGYRREPYTDIGWFSARLEDVLTWIPCRLTVLTLALFSGKPIAVLSICRRDGVKDPSPNSGWSEAVYAAILGVQLGGINYYKGEINRKPLLGEPKFLISPKKIEYALSLTRYCFLAWLAIAEICWFFVGMLN